MITRSCVTSRAPRPRLYTSRQTKLYYPTSCLSLSATTAGNQLLAGPTRRTEILSATGTVAECSGKPIRQSIGTTRKRQPYGITARENMHEPNILIAAMVALMTSNTMISTAKQLIERCPVHEQLIDRGHDAGHVNIGSGFIRR